MFFFCILQAGQQHVVGQNWPEGERSCITDVRAEGQSKNIQHKYIVLLMTDY